MIKAIRRHGNSHAVLLDKPLLELLGVGAGSELQVSVSGGSLVLTPIDGRPLNRDVLRDELDDLADRFGVAFDGLE